MSAVPGYTSLTEQCRRSRCKPLLQSSVGGPGYTSLTEQCRRSRGIPLWQSGIGGPGVYLSDIAVSAVPGSTSLTEQYRRSRGILFRQSGVGGPGVYLSDRAVSAVPRYNSLTDRHALVALTGAASQRCVCNVLSACYRIGLDWKVGWADTQLGWALRLLTNLRD